MNSDGTRTTTAPVAPAAGPLHREDLDQINTWWRAAKYRSVHQIYPTDNPPPRERGLGLAARAQNRPLREPV